MRTDISKVDDKMEVLNNSMEKITNLAQTIDDNLKTKRKEIWKLETVNQDLDKLSSLCEFPSIL